MERFGKMANHNFAFMSISIPPPDADPPLTESPLLLLVTAGSEVVRRRPDQDVLDCGLNMPLSLFSHRCSPAQNGTTREATEDHRLAPATDEQSQQK